MESLAAYNGSLRARRLRVHSIGSLADAPETKPNTDKHNLTNIVYQINLGNANYLQHKMNKTKMYQ